MGGQSVYLAMSSSVQAPVGTGGVGGEVAEAEPGGVVVDASVVESVSPKASVPAPAPAEAVVGVASDTVSGSEPGAVTPVTAGLSTDSETVSAFDETDLVCARA